MTCAEFFAVADRFYETTRAERRAMAGHYWSCLACRTTANAQAAAIAAADPRALATSANRAVALALGDRAAADPEARP